MQTSRPVDSRVLVCEAGNTGGVNMLGRLFDEISKENLAAWQVTEFTLTVQVMVLKKECCIVSVH